MFGGLLSTLGVKKYLPGGPVLSASERARFDRPGPSEARYTGDAKVDFPLVPLQVWGVAYDLDLVLETTHPDYDMHEYARVQTPEGPVWLAKDALAATKLQSIVADLPDLARWVPELPIERKPWPVEVVDRSTERWLDLEIRYENLAGEPVEVTYQGRTPHSRQRKRSGSTMGHSASIAMAALDIPYRDFGRRASVRIDGVDWPIRRLLGLVPLRVVLVQSQGGLAVGRLGQRSTDEGFELVYRLDGLEVTTAWTVEAVDGKRIATHADRFRALVYTWAERDGSLELERMEVRQFAVDEPVAIVALDPALPDLRRPFEGTVRSRFTVDIGGQRGLAVGALAAHWEGDGPVVEMVPAEPEWVSDRPMRTRITLAGDTAEIVIART